MMYCVVISIINSANLYTLHSMLINICFTQYKD